MQRLQLEKERKIIEFYKKKNSLRETAIKFNVGHNTIRRVLLRNNVDIRGMKGLKKTEEHRKKLGKRLKRTHKEWKKRDPIGYRLHQQKAAEKGARKGGLATHKKHPHLARERALIVMKKYPDHLNRLGKITQERRPDVLQNLLKWKKNNYELARTISKETIKRTLRTFPDLPKRAGLMMHIKHPGKASKTAKETHKKRPELASQMGKSTHKKHPRMASERMKKTIKEWKERDPEGYSKACAKGMVSNALKKPTKPEKKMQSLLPKDFAYNKLMRLQTGYCVPDFRSLKRKIIIEVDGPTHYRTMGTKYSSERLQKTKLKDKLRKKEWRKNGYKVYRFFDFDVMKNEKRVRKKLKRILD